jgi:hypothetical protein
MFVGVQVMMQHGCREQSAIFERFDQAGRELRPAIDWRATTAGIEWTM